MPFRATIFPTVCLLRNRAKRSSGGPWTFREFLLGLGAAGPFALLLFASCSTQPPAEPAQRPKPKHAKILHFYGASNQTPKGEPLTVCYGVEDATSVRMEPAEEELGLSHNRCIAIHPKQNTTYALIAKGADGEEVRKTFAVTIVAASAAGPPAQQVLLIRSFDVMTGNPGQPIQLCYATQGAKTLKLEPPVSAVEPSETPRCFPVNITAKTRFLLTATDASGRIDRMQVTASP